MTESPAESPLVLTETENQTQKLYAVCPAAASIGLAPGMTLAEARAIKPDIEVRQANRESDAESLESLARWLVRYSPLVALDGPDGILLDVTGCPHLFGGERAMMDDIQRRLESAGMCARLAMAENQAAAWALAHFRPGTISRDAADTRAQLAPLPAAALRLDSASVQTLARLGLKTAGSLFDLPRPALARRFRGKPSKMVADLLTRLDMAIAGREAPISPLEALPSWQVRQAFAEPVLHTETVEIACRQLLEELTGALARAEHGLSRLGLHAFRVDGSVQQITIGTNRPSRDAGHLMRLLAEKIPLLEADFGFDLLILKAYETERLAPAQLTSSRDREDQTASEVLDRLSTRLGPGTVRRLKHRRSHLPERMQSFMPVGADASDWESLPDDLPDRPLRLLCRPEAIDVLAEVPEGAPKRFRWRRMEHRVVRAAGPERIAPEWWLCEEDRTRDYYKVEVSSGARFWLFRYGLYLVPGPGAHQAEPAREVPDWYLHGFFP
ncbi:protein ImuB [Kordiimonas lacus]|uniref:Protein ImuB n=1 Tax=Kordiimonas lacus TaxID=637679 RepID=A0A1G6WI33_9PROT|nr:protein ImuB [Kordiimonas lacus]